MNGPIAPSLTMEVCPKFGHPALSSELRTTKKKLPCEIRNNFKTNNQLLIHNFC